MDTAHLYAKESIVPVNEVWIPVSILAQSIQDSCNQIFCSTNEPSLVQMLEHFKCMLILLAIELQNVVKYWVRAGRWM